MKIAGLQTDIVWEDPAPNFAQTRALAALAVAGGARLLVLPEMFAVGFSMAPERVVPAAASTRDFLSDLARAHAVWVLAGLPEEAADRGQAGGRPVNAALVFDPQGQERLRYLKIHPFSLAGEQRHYAGGKSLSTLEIEGLRITPLICYDLRFPELFRARAAETDLFVVIANWPSARRAHWRTLLRARAIENQVWLLGVNRVGQGDGLDYAGDSALIDPLGETVAEAAGQEALVAGEVDAGRVQELRARLSFLADRKPELYGKL